MKLYRLGGEFRNIEFSYRLDKATGNRVEVGLIDQYSLDRLTRLVNGGIQHISDLYAIEMALKGLIFHDAIQAITPSAKLQVVNPSGGEPFYMNISPPSDNNAVLQEILVLSKCQGMLCGIAQLVGFANEDKAEQFISQHNKNYAAKREARNELFQQLGMSVPTLPLDPQLVPLEFVASDSNQFFSTLDDSAMKRLLAPVAISGHATYLGDPNVRMKSESLKNYNAEQFFGTLDKGWREHNMLLKRVLDIPVPLFVTIVLSRAAKREDIPNQILLLRQEFAEARHQLWDLFDEADFRIFDSSASARLLKNIEGEAAGIIPKWRDAHEFWFPIKFDFLGRMVELNAIGLLKDIAGFLKSTIASQSICVDASALLVKQLSSIELRGLIERHLSEPELRMVAESINWSQ